MIYKRVGIFALCAMLCGILLGCKKEPEVVFLSLPEDENLEDQSSLMENIQEVAGQMLPQMDSFESTEDNNPAIIQTPAPATANMGEETANLPPDIDPNLPMVALTFDDGPGSVSTTRILDALEANGARATFFVQGKQAVLYPELIQRAYSMGCQIGNHTYNHKDLTSLSDQEALEQVESLNELVREVTGEGCALVRPPYGKGWKDEHVLNLIPYPLIMWSIDTLDWKTKDSASTIKAVMDNVKDGDIILMHDIYEQSAEAAEAIIPALQERGFQLVTVSEMFACKNIPLEAGHAYRKAVQ